MVMYSRSRLGMTGCTPSGFSSDSLFELFTDFGQFGRLVQTSIGQLAEVRAERFVFGSRGQQGFRRGVAVVEEFRFGL